MSPTTGLIYAGVATTITVCRHWGAYPAEAEAQQPYFFDVSFLPVDYEQYYSIPMLEFPSAIQRITSELRWYSGFDQNWSGEGSVAPSVDSVKEAINFISAFPAALELPSPTLSADGEVGFYWTSPKGYIDCRVEGPGRVTLYLRNRLTGVDQFYDKFDWQNMTRQHYEKLLGFLASGERVAF